MKTYKFKMYYLKLREILEEGKAIKIKKMIMDNIYRYLFCEEIFQISLHLF